MNCSLVLPIKLSAFAKSFPISAGTDFLFSASLLLHGGSSEWEILVRSLVDKDRCFSL